MRRVLLLAVLSAGLALAPLGAPPRSAAAQPCVSGAAQNGLPIIGNDPYGAPIQPTYLDNSCINNYGGFTADYGFYGYPGYGYGYGGYAYSGYGYGYYGYGGYRPWHYSSGSYGYPWSGYSSPWYGNYGGCCPTYPYR